MSHKNNGQATGKAQSIFGKQLLLLLFLGRRFFLDGRLCQLAPLKPVVLNSKYQDQASKVTIMKMKTIPAVIAGLIATPLIAKTPENGVLALEEVVVTAQHRTEAVQDTPLAITALTALGLDKQGISSLADLGVVAPGLQSDDSGQVFLRGIGSTNLNESGGPALAYQIDGIYLARTSSLNGLFFDVERVEVLRGPQGTLYGRNATAGAINVVNARPQTDDIHGKISYGLGNYNAQKMSGMLNLPLTDNLAVRGAFQSVQHGPYIENLLAGGSDAGDQNDVSGRLSLSYQPTDTMDIYIAVDSLHQGGYAGFSGNSNSSQTIGEFSDEPAHPRYINSPVSTNKDNVYEGVTAEVNWDLGLGTLTYLTGFRSEERDESGHTLRSDRSYFKTRFNNEDTTLSHELRYVINTDRINWVGGLYYFNENNDVDFKAGPYASFASGGTVSNFRMHHVQEDSKAAFTQLTYSIMDSLRVTGGLRYTKDHREREGILQLYNLSTGATTPLTPQDGNVDFDKTTWKLGIDYDLGDSSMVYTSVTTGYKAGGYFSAGTFDEPVSGVFKPENLTSYALGAKSQFLDNRAQLNVEAFFYDYTDFQALSQIILPTEPPQPSGATVNAEASEIFGIEVESKFLLTESDRLDLNLAFMNAEYTDFYLENGDGFSNAGLASTDPRIPADFSGQTMANAPEWTATIGYEHDWALSKGLLTARLQSHYESENYLDYHLSDETIQDAYTKTDLTLSYMPDDGDWVLRAYVRNIEDADVKVFSFPQTPSTATAPEVFQVQYAAPRLFGIEASYEF